jgi:hypothetical protein
MDGALTEDSVAFDGHQPSQPASQTIESFDALQKFGPGAVKMKLK